MLLLWSALSISTKTIIFIINFFTYSEGKLSNLLSKHKSPNIFSAISLLWEILHIAFFILFYQSNQGLFLYFTSTKISCAIFFTVFTLSRISSRIPRKIFNFYFFYLNNPVCGAKFIFLGTLFFSSSSSYSQSLQLLCNWPQNVEPTSIQQFHT